MTPVILHLSDIHRTRDEPVTNEEIIHPLLADLDRYSAEGIPLPNVLVISGDLTQSAQPGEYQEASELIQKVLGRLSISVDRLVVVPGNHDIDWQRCYEVFRLLPAAPAAIPRELCFEVGGEILCPKSEDAFEERLDNFRRFYKDLVGKEYPRDRKNHFTTQTFPDLGLAIAGFSSCDTISHKAKRGKINVSAIHQAVTALDGFSGTTIAVWHHDLNWRADTGADNLDVESLRHVSERLFDYGLCGHTHRPATHDVVHMGGIPMPVIAAGSLCAGARERPESVPRSYNVIEIHDQRIKVHVRGKEEKSTPWGSRPVRKGLEWARHYEVARPSRPRREAVPELTHLGPQEAKIPTPFAAINAKAATRQEVVRQYVWTEQAYALDDDNPQIVIGPRGAGKTALLLSLTFEGRLASPKCTSAAATVRRLGLMCAMNVGETTAFNGKGWLVEGERKEVFNATIGTIWAQELVHTLEKCLPWAKNRGVECPDEAVLATVIGQMLAAESQETTLAGLSRWIKNLRSRLIMAIGIRNDERREQVLAELMANPVTRGTPGFLSDIAGELARFPLFAATRWALLFDEVEYLNGWQQEAVYSFLAEASQYVVAKLATLPYAHARVLRMADQHMLAGNDFAQIALSLTAELELQTGDDEGSKKFEELATQLWKNRLEAAGIQPRLLEEAWPDATYESVVSTALRRPVVREELELALIQQIAPDSRSRAAALRLQNHAGFLDQYWRKYAQPFRIRYAQTAEVEGYLIPLVWGWRALLRACDGNCRWFLRLADECWSRGWARKGIVEMSPQEQYNALKTWAGQIYRVVGTMTREGPALKEIIDRAAADLRGRLANLPHLLPEALTFQVKDVSDDQAEAIAVGVALGYLVPRVETGQPSVYYPVKNVELRLGFPLAIEKRLPLRSGAVLKIGDLKQVEFEWLMKDDVV